MDWLALSVFTEVAAGSSLAGAARTLRIQPMAATRHLSSLERELGVRLVHRTTRSLALTADGEAFLPHARALQEQRAAAIASVTPDSGGVVGLLRMTTSIAFGRKVVSPLIAQFMRDHPAVRVDLLMTDVQLDLVNEGLDLAIRIARLEDSSLIARKLAPSPRVLVASPEYLARFGAPGTLDDLRKHECLRLTGTASWSFTGAGQPVKVKVDGRFSANSIEGLLQLCLGGLGIANLSSWYVEEELRRGGVKAIELAEACPEELGVWAVYPTSRLVPAKVRTFIDVLGAHLRDRNFGSPIR